MKNKFSQSDMSLFLSCSVSLILISIFILIDIEKFTVKENSENKGPIQSLVSLHRQQSGVPSSKEEFFIDCYKANHVKEGILEPTLSEEHIAQLAKNIGTGDSTVPDDVMNILKVRDICGYVAYEFTVDVSSVKERKEGDMERLLHNYYAMRQKIRSVSKNVSIKIRL